MFLLMLIDRGSWIMDHGSPGAPSAAPWPRDLNLPPFFFWASPMFTFFRSFRRGWPRNVITCGWLAVLSHARMMIVAVMLTRWLIGELRNTWHLQDAARPGTVHSTEYYYQRHRCIAPPVYSEGGLERSACHYNITMYLYKVPLLLSAYCVKVPSGSYRFGGNISR